MNSLVIDFMLGEFRRIAAGGGEHAGPGHTSQLLQETVRYVVFLSSAGVVLMKAEGIQDDQLRLNAKFRFECL